MQHQNTHWSNSRARDTEMNETLKYELFILARVLVVNPETEEVS